MHRPQPRVRVPDTLEGGELVDLHATAVDDSAMSSPTSVTPETGQGHGSVEQLAFTPDLSVVVEQRSQHRSASAALGEDQESATLAHDPPGIERTQRSTHLAAERSAWWYIEVPGCSVVHGQPALRARVCGDGGCRAPTTRAPRRHRTRAGRCDGACL